LANRTGTQGTARLDHEEAGEGQPDIDTDKPVSRQYEMNYLSYYGYPYYWGGAGLWGGARSRA